MSDIEPGDYVKCIRTLPEHRLAPWVFPPKKDSLWVVDDVGVGRSLEGDEGIGLLLDGDDLPRLADRDGYLPCWDARYFRKLYRPKADLIERLLQPIDDELANPHPHRKEQA